MFDACSLCHRGYVWDVCYVYMLCVYKQHACITSSAAANARAHYTVSLASNCTHSCRCTAIRM